MSVKLLTEHHLEFLSLNGGCTGLSESTLVKMPHCWKSHVAAQTKKMEIDEDGDQDDEGDNVEYSLPAEGKLSESKGVVQKMDFDDNDDDENSLPAGGKVSE